MSCYRLFKQRGQPCLDCPVDRTFEDGESHMSQHMGMNREGKPVPYLVFTTPISRGDEKVSHVMEMALDMTELRELERQLSQANVLRHALVENSLDCIVVFDDRATNPARQPGDGDVARSLQGPADRAADSPPGGSEGTPRSVVRQKVAGGSARDERHRTRRGSRFRSGSPVSP